MVDDDSVTQGEELGPRYQGSTERFGERYSTRIVRLVPRENDDARVRGGQVRMRKGRYGMQSGDDDEEDDGVVYRRGRV